MTDEEKCFFCKKNIIDFHYVLYITMLGVPACPDCAYKIIEQRNKFFDFKEN